VVVIADYYRQFHLFLDRYPSFRECNVTYGNYYEHLRGLDPDQTLFIVTGSQNKISTQDCVQFVASRIRGYHAPAYHCFELGY
jgi:hypothetical protein